MLLWGSKEVKPQHDMGLYITFKAEEQGDFEGYITIDCSPIEIPVRGDIKEKEN